MARFGGHKLNFFLIILIAALMLGFTFFSGEKFELAKKVGIKLVNHRWLEDW